MALTRNGSVLNNTDSEAYVAAKKRKELQKERKKKDALLETLNEKVNVLEQQMKEVLSKLEKIYDIS